MRRTPERLGVFRLVDCEHGNSPSRATEQRGGLRSGDAVDGRERAAGGWLAAFLAAQCRTAPDDSESVRRYLYVAASFALLPLAFLPLVPAPEPPPEESDESSDDDVSLVL